MKVEPATKRIILEAIARIVDRKLWKTNGKDRKEIDQLPFSSKEVVATHAWVGHIARYGVQSVQEFYSSDVMWTYTLVFEVQDGEIIKGLLSADVTAHADGTGIMSDRRVYAVAGHPDRIDILKPDIATLDGLTSMMETVARCLATAEDRKINPRFAEIILKCRKKILKEKASDESTAVIDNY